MNILEPIAIPRSRARRELRGLMRKSKTGQVFMITRCGEAEAYFMSHEKHAALEAEHRKLSKQLLRAGIRTSESAVDVLSRPR